MQDFQLENFKDSNHLHLDIPDKPGNYIVCVNNGCELPNLGCEVKYSLFRNQKVIYTGITSKSLRNRYLKQHFNGDNAGRSTLRLSLGILLGYQKIHRDKDNINNKYRFNTYNEIELSAWMKRNLTFYYLGGEDVDEIENVIIKRLNPPLNLSKNSSIINLDFRRKLKSLRIAKISTNIDASSEYFPQSKAVKNQTVVEINSVHNTSISLKTILKYIAYIYIFCRLISFIMS